MQDLFDAVDFQWINNLLTLIGLFVAVAVLFLAHRSVVKALRGGAGDGSSLSKEEKEYLRNNRH